MVEHGPIDMKKVYCRLPPVSALDELADRPSDHQIIQQNRFDEVWKAYCMKGRHQEVETPE